MERRPQPLKRVASRPMPALAHAGAGRQRAQPQGVIELPDEYAGLDPDLRAFLRAPYDPLNSVMAARFIARGLLRQPLAYGWMRHIALLVALVLVGTLVVSLLGFAGLVVSGGAEEALIFALQILVISGPLGAFGLVLLWRLARY
jgi:hypothetical protein